MRCGISVAETFSRESGGRVIAFSRESGGWAIVFRRESGGWAIIFRRERGGWAIARTEAKGKEQPCIRRCGSSVAGVCTLLAHGLISFESTRAATLYA